MSRTDIPGTLSRRSLLQASAGLAGGALLPSAFSIPAFAVGEQSPIGTWPDGSKGNSVTVSIAVPRTGTYAVQGEDELKGWQLAVEHMNSGHELMKKFSPKRLTSGPVSTSMSPCTLVMQASRMVSS